NRRLGVPCKAVLRYRLGGKRDCGLHFLGSRLKVLGKSVCHELLPIEDSRSGPNAKHLIKLGLSLWRWVCLKRRNGLRRWSASSRSPLCPVQPENLSGLGHNFVGVLECGLSLP